MSLNIKNIYLKLKKNQLYIVSSLGTLLIAGYICIIQPGIGYAITANGEFVGYASNPLEIKAITYALNKDVKNENGNDASYNLDLSYVPGKINTSDLTDSTEIKNNIADTIDVMVPGVVIKAGSDAVMAVENLETANSVLEKIQEPFKNIATDVKVEFAENVEVLEIKQVYKSEIYSPSLALSSATNNTSDIVNRSYDRSSVPESILTNPLIDVKTTYTFEGVEDMAIPVEIIKDPYLKKGEKRIENNGNIGSRDVKKVVTSINNKVVNEQILKETIITAPISKVIYEGTGEKSNSGLGIIAYANKFLGVRYRWGGTTPSGFDCSGFTSYVYRQFGISLPRTSSSQASVGKSVSYSQAVPGDLVVFSGHVGIYVGDGNMIHSPSPGQSVTISPISTFGKSIKSIRRLI